MIGYFINKLIKPLLVKKRFDIIRFTEDRPIGQNKDKYNNSEAILKEIENVRQKEK